MTLREIIKTPRLRLQIGLVFLIIASLSKWYFRAHATPDEWTDGITGLLYGVSIGFMLLGIWGMSRPKQSDE